MILSKILSIIAATLLITPSTLMPETDSHNLKDKLLKDYNLFLNTLIETHPEPFSGFESRAAFHKAAENLRKDIIKVQDSKSFAIKLNSFLAKLKDGHSRMKIPVDKSVKILHSPIRYKAASDSIFIQNGTDEYKALIGMKVVSINGFTYSELLKKASALFPSENLPSEMNNLIKILHNTRYHKIFFKKTASLKLKLSNGNKTINRKIEYLLKPKYQAQDSSIKFSKPNGLLFADMLGRKKDIAYLRWDSTVSREYLEFMHAKNPQHFRNQLSWPYGYLRKPVPKDTSKALKQIPPLYKTLYTLLEKMKQKRSRYLIIDLRHNSGGMTPLTKSMLYMLYGDTYLKKDFKAQYLTKLSPLYLANMGYRDIAQYNQKRKTSFKTGDFNRNNHFGNPGTGLSLLQKREFMGRGYYGFGSEYVERAVKMAWHPPHIIVLTSPRTFSAAYHLTYFLKKMGNVKIVGVASGQAGNSFMNFTNFKLPYTGVYGSISNAKQILFPADSPYRKVLTPDFEMTWKDFASYNFDPNAELLKAIELFRDSP